MSGTISNTVLLTVNRRSGNKSSSRCSEPCMTVFVCLNYDLPGLVNSTSQGKERKESNHNKTSMKLKAAETETSGEVKNNRVLKLMKELEVNWECATRVTVALQ